MADGCYSSAGAGAGTATAVAGTAAAAAMVAACCGGCGRILLHQDGGVGGVGDG